MFELLDLRLNLRRTLQRFLTFLFHGDHLLFQLGHQLLLLARDPGRQTVLAGLPGAHELFFELVAPLHQVPEFVARRFGRGRRLGPQRLPVGGEHRRVDGIVFGPLALGQGEVADQRGVEHAHGLSGRVQRGDDAFFVAAGGFADHLHSGHGADFFEQGGVAFGGVVQDVLDVLEVELEGGLGDVQAGMDGRVVFFHGVRGV